MKKRSKAKPVITEAVLKKLNSLENMAKTQDGFISVSFFDDGSGRCQDGNGDGILGTEFENLQQFLDLLKDKDGKIQARERALHRIKELEATLNAAKIEYDKI